MSNCNIAFVGDVMCGDSFYTIGSGVASQLEKYAKNFLSKDIVKFLRSHEIVFCNVESVLSDIGMNRYSLRSMHMRGKPEYANYLADWGINTANIANNHILEQGYDAAVDTVVKLEQTGVRTIGAGKDHLFGDGIQAAEFSLNDQSIVLIGICLLEEKYAFDGGLTFNQTIEVIEKLKKQNKIVIVSVHWGYELMDRPDASQRQWASRFVDAGARLIIGHHPHVVQGIEKLNDSLVAYSLGNFIFNGFRRDTRWSIILSVKLQDNMVTQWRAIPIETDKDHRPEFAKGPRKQQLDSEMERRCQLLNSQLPKHQYHHEYKKRISQWNQQLRLELLRNFFQMNPVFWPQIPYRFVQRRLNRW